MKPHLASIPRGEKYTCCARQGDGSARHCRRTATRFVITDGYDWWWSHAPVCDRHAQAVLTAAIDLFDSEPHKYENEHQVDEARER